MLSRLCVKWVTCSKMEHEPDYYWGTQGSNSIPISKKKSDTQACHSECLHNGIILIVYILQICWCKGSTFHWNNKIYSYKFAYFLFFLYFCRQIVHWNPDKTTSFPSLLTTFWLCIAYKSIFEILIKQLTLPIWNGVARCVLHTKVSLKSW